MILIWKLTGRKEHANLHVQNDYQEQVKHHVIKGERLETIT